MDPQAQTRLSPTESAWLRMGGPDTPLVTTALMVLDTAIDQNSLKGVIEDRLMSHSRFRECAVASKLPLGRPHWVERDDFAMKNHFGRIDLQSSPAERDLESVLSRLLLEPMDLDKPLWNVLQVDMGERSAVVLRVHQSIGDCFSVLRLLSGMSGQSGLGEDGPSRQEGEATFGLVEPGAVLECAGQTGCSARALVRLIAMRSDARSMLSADTAEGLRASWPKALDLDPFSEAAQRQVSPGALVLSMLTGAVRSLLESSAMTPRPESVRAVVPVDLRTAEERDLLGSRFGALLVPLPVSLDTFEARLAAVAKSLEAVLASPESVVAFGVHERPGVAMMEFEEQAMALMSRKASLAVSLSAGPTRVLELAGCRVDDLRIWPPCAGQHGLVVNALSYAGKTRFAIRSSPGCLPEPGVLFDALGSASDRI